MVGLVVMVTATAAHVAGGGGVTLAAVLTFGLASVAAGLLASVRRWRLPALVTAMSGAQLAAHVLLTALAPAHHVARVNPDANATHRPAMPGGPMGMSMPVPADAASTAGSSWVSDLPMLLAHALAVAVAVWAVRRGEATVSALIALLRSVVAPLRPTRLRLTVPWSPAPCTVTVIPVLAIARYSFGWRGPPSSHAVV